MAYTNKPIIVYQCNFNHAKNVLFEQEALYKHIRETRGAPYYPDLWDYEKLIHAKFIIKLKNVYYGAAEIDRLQK